MRIKNYIRYVTSTQNGEDEDDDDEEEKVYNQWQHIEIESGEKTQKLKK